MLLFFFTVSNTADLGCTCQSAGGPSKKLDYPAILPFTSPLCPQTQLPPVPLVGPTRLLQLANEKVFGFQSTAFLTVLSRQTFTEISGKHFGQYINTSA